MFFPSNLRCGKGAACVFVIVTAINIIIGVHIYRTLKITQLQVRTLNLTALRHVEHSKDEVFHKNQDRSVAEELQRRVRVLCWVMTNPQNHQEKAQHVKATWGTRCDVLLFMSSAEDPSLPTVALPVEEGRENLWKKTREAFKYVYENYLDAADWFLKADDDTYVIVENLRYMLYAYNSSDPIYFGCRFKPFTKQGYMSGGAGYVLSKEAVRRFAEDGLSNTTVCSLEGSAEDVEMGKCLENLSVKAGDSRDPMGRWRFFPFIPEHHLIPGINNPDFWFYSYTYYESKEGMDCCSDNAISFHYISPNMMYVMEYLIYHLNPYGITNRYELLKEEDLTHERLKDLTINATTSKGTSTTLALNSSNNTTQP